MKSALFAALLLFSLSAHADAVAIETLDDEGFREVLVRSGDLFISGQPSRAGLERLQREGVTTVVNLRTDAEMDDREIVDFDEAAAVRELGMTYVHIPSGGPDTPYSPEMVSRFAEAVEQADGKVLLHCTVAWRASHLYSAYLNQYQGLSLSDAVAAGQQINLGTLPLQGFLGETLEIVVAEPDAE
jgi:uncharacterized protein (TIGR01244 family)